MGASPPVTVWVAAGLGAWIGCWLLFDGLHHVAYGDFVRLNGQLGPWASACSAVGIDPMRMRIPFLFLGAAWVAGSVGLALLKRWAWVVALVLAAITLLYCCIGTFFAAAVLVLLVLKRTRESFQPRGA